MSATERPLQRAGNIAFTIRFGKAESFSHRPGAKKKTAADYSKMDY